MPSVGRKTLSAFAVLGAIVVAVEPARAERATEAGFHLYELDRAPAEADRAFRDAMSLAGLLDRSDETARFAFAVDGDLASADLGVMPLTHEWSVALEPRGSFLQNSMPPAFASAGGPTPYSAGAVAGHDLLTGVKATGHLGSLEYGVLTFELDDSATARGHDQVGVGRVVFDMAEGLRIGAIATAGDPRHDGQSYLVGTDLTLKTRDLVEGRSLEAGFWVQQSMTARDDADEDTLDGALGFRVSYPNDVVRWSVSFAQVGEEFDAAVGSVPRRGVREYSGLWHCRVRPGGLIRSVETGVEASTVSWLDSDEAHHRIRVSPVALELATNDRVRFDYLLHREARSHATRVGPRVLPPGEYSYGRYEIAASTTPSRPVRFDVRVGGGQYYTGDRVDARVAASWKVNPAIQVTAGYEQADIDIEDTTWRSRVVRGNFSAAIAPTASLTNAIWYDHVNGKVGVDGRLRWDIEPGNGVVVNVSPRFATSDSSATKDELDLVTSLRWSREF